MSPADDQEVVVVDGLGNELGVTSKRDAHRSPGVLHRAVSAWLVDPGGQVLLQRRALSKYHFAGRWSNACCSHPRPGERPIHAIHRRVREELGIDCSLTEVGQFRYFAADPASGLVERELDHVFVGQVDDRPQPDREEIMDHAFVEPQTLAGALADPARAGRFTPWLVDVMRVVGPTDPLRPPR